MKNVNPAALSGFEERPRKAYESDLDLLMVEGTGAQHPLLKSDQEYFNDAGLKQRALKRQRFQTKLLSWFRAEPEQNKKEQDPDFMLLPVLPVEAIPMLDDFVPNSRLTPFYRRQVSFWNAETQEGLIVQVGQRNDESSQTLGGNKGDNKNREMYGYGANVRDTVYFNTHHQNDVGIMSVPRWTKEERKLIENLARHLPPLVLPTLSEKNVRATWALRSAVSQFNEGLRHRNLLKEDHKESKVAQVNRDYTHIYMVLRGDLFTREGTNPKTKEQVRLRDFIMKDIETIAKNEAKRGFKFMGARAETEILTKQMRNVRFDFFFTQLPNNHQSEETLSSRMLIAHPNLLNSRASAAFEHARENVLHFFH